MRSPGTRNIRWYSPAVEGAASFILRSVTLTSAVRKPNGNRYPG